MNEVIVIAGPTGVGKTKLSISLAKELNGEIINCDSMQIYKGLDIGTAKATKEEMENIPHHLLDIKKVSEEYSIYNYQKDARNKIEEILSKNKTPILVGGTGLYIKAALYDYNLNEENTKDLYENKTTEELYNELLKLDEKGISIDRNNRRRIINAINYYNNNNKSITENKTDKILYNVKFIGLTTERSNLYNIINKRVDEMINNGLIDEVKKFHDQNIYTKPLTVGIGYKEIYKYLDNIITKEEAIEEIKKNSRHYAKRQYTFFNNQLNIKWFETNYKNFEETINEVINYIKEVK